VCTIGDGTYLPFLRVMSEAFRRHHPEVSFHPVLLPGGAQRPTRADRAQGLLDARALGIPGLWRMRRRYAPKQVAAAQKPVVLRKLLERGFDPVIFLDPDVLVTASLDPLFERVARHSLTLTPHKRQPAEALRDHAFDEVLLLSGIYNAGFVGVSDRAETHRFLAWWEDRLREHCLDAPQRGFHFDQRWLDHAVGFVHDLHVLRDPGCNLAYWNLRDHDVCGEGERLVVDGSPLRFFHFSGFDPGRPDRVSVDAPDWRVAQLGAARALFETYASRLHDAGWRPLPRPSRRWRWARWRRPRRRDRRAPVPSVASPATLGPEPSWRRAGS
jgi:hypothetical protein